MSHLDEMGTKPGTMGEFSRECALLKKCHCSAVGTEVRASLYVAEGLVAIEGTARREPGIHDTWLWKVSLGTTRLRVLQGMACRSTRQSRQVSLGTTRLRVLQGPGDTRYRPRRPRFI